jgi:transcriptional regulator with XRE-family HTH domain
MANDELTARQAVKMWLARHERTQTWLARRVGVSEPTLSKILAGHVSASDDARKRLARVTGVDISTFAKVA